jgi:hypothetical protein
LILAGVRLRWMFGREQAAVCCCFAVHGGRKGCS